MRSLETLRIESCSAWPRLPPSRSVAPALGPAHTGHNATAARPIQRLIVIAFVIAISVFLMVMAVGTVFRPIGISVPMTVVLLVSINGRVIIAPLPIIPAIRIWLLLGLKRWPDSAPSSNCVQNLIHRETSSRLATNETSEDVSNIS